MKIFAKTKQLVEEYVEAVRRRLTLTDRHRHGADTEQQASAETVTDEHEAETLAMNRSGAS